MIEKEILQTGLVYFFHITLLFHGCLSHFSFFVFYFFRSHIMDVIFIAVVGSTNAKELIYKGAQIAVIFHSLTGVVIKNVSAVYEFLLTHAPSLQKLLRQVWSL